MLTPATNTVPINISSPWLKTLSWLLFILTFKYDTPHAVKGDKSYDCESCHFASHNLDRFCNWCKPGSRKWESNDLSLAAMSHQISVTHSLCSRHILVRSTSRETYFLCFFFQHSMRSKAPVFLGRKKKYLAACKKKITSPATQAMSVQHDQHGARFKKCLRVYLGYSKFKSWKKFSSSCLKKIKKNEKPIERALGHFKMLN